MQYLLSFGTFSVTSNPALTSVSMPLFTHSVEVIFDSKLCSSTYLDAYKKTKHTSHSFSSQTVLSCAFPPPCFKSPLALPSFGAVVPSQTPSPLLVVPRPPSTLPLAYALMVHLHKALLYLLSLMLPILLAVCDLFIKFIEPLGS